MKEHYLFVLLLHIHILWIIYYWEYHYFPFYFNNCFVSIDKCLFHMFDVILVDFINNWERYLRLINDRFFHDELSKVSDSLLEY